MLVSKNVENNMSKSTEKNQRMYMRYDMRKYLSIGSVALVAVLFLICLYAFHDIQTAQGIGLYFSMKLGMESRVGMDLLVDAAGMLALALLIVLPCWKQGKGCADGMPEACLRLFIVYLAAVPILSPAKVLQLFQGYEIVFLWDIGLKAAVWEWFYHVTHFCQVWLPLILVLIAFTNGMPLNESCVIDRFFILRRHKIMGAAVILLLFILLLVPTAENVILYVCGYLGLWYAFEQWEQLLNKNQKLKKWSLLLFGLLLCRGLYRILVLVSQM